MLGATGPQPSIQDLNSGPNQGGSLAMALQCLPRREAPQARVQGDPQGSQLQSFIGIYGRLVPGSPAFTKCQLRMIGPFILDGAILLTLCICEFSIHR